MSLLIGACSLGSSEDEGADIDSTSRQPDGTADDDNDQESSSPPDDADQTGETAEGETTESEEPNGALLLIMDASGSMNETDVNGQPLIDGAKQALHGVVDALPDGTNVGLRVYGHRFPNTDRANGCQDTELISPVEPLDRDALNGAIDSYEAVGFTPIGLSLQQAVDDLPPEGPRTIMLVSDGEDTCAPPDPCQVAEEIRADGVELVIHTVGFALPDDASRQQLQCIAEAGGGEFHDASTAADLADTLADVSEREARDFETAGTELAGAPVPRDANTGEVDTAHTDTVLGNETNYYRFEIEPGGEIRGEMIVDGNPSGEGSLFCANLYLTDQADDDHAHADFGGTTDAAQPLIKETEPVVVDDDEVWLKIETDGCSGPGSLRDTEFDVEIRLTILD